MARPTLLPVLLLLYLSALVLMPLPVVVVQAYPHYLLNPEGCLDKKLEVGDEGGREGGQGRAREQSRGYVCQWLLAVVVK